MVFYRVILHVATDTKCVEHRTQPQYSDRGRFGPYTDIFCLGATLYHALVGTPPPDALTRLQSIDFLKGLNGSLCEAVRQALALRVEDRPATAADFGGLLITGRHQQLAKGHPQFPIHDPSLPRHGQTAIPARP